MKRLFLLTAGLLILFGFGSLVASRNSKKKIPQKIEIPDIPGYRTLKGDFHLHTVFSDGTVWPLTRVKEAVEEGLDAIAITDHIDYQKVLRWVPRDHNRSYEITRANAQKKNILLVKGVEINQKLPPGHFNAFFIRDGQTIAKKDIRECALEVKRQGGFLIWNHPGLRTQHPAVNTWFTTHEWLYEQQLLKGIEVYSHDAYYEKAFEKAVEKNLTVFSNTDNHYLIRKDYDLVKGHRPITLVFAKERSVEAIHEAFLEGRTAAFSEQMIRGPEKWLVPLVHACIKSSRSGERLELRNVSGLQFEMEEVKVEDPLKLSLKAHGTLSILARDSIRLKIMNFETAPGKCLEAMW